MQSMETTSNSVALLQLQHNCINILELCSVRNLAPSHSPGPRLCRWTLHRTAMEPMETTGESVLLLRLQHNWINILKLGPVQNPAPSHPLYPGP